MIYLDSAALIKLLRREPESGGLVEWLGQRRELPLVASALVEIEVPRALRRAVPQALVGAPALLARLHRVEIDVTVRATAAAYTQASLAQSRPHPSRDRSGHSGGDGRTNRGVRHL